MQERWLVIISDLMGFLMFNKRLCVVIINYKTPQLTFDCLDTLVCQLDHKKDHVVIVDNMSGGDDVVLIQRWIDGEGLSSLVTLITSPVNNGFSAGNNIGIQSIDSDYYLLANADTLFRPQAIQGLLKAAEKYQEAGIISPRLEWPDGNSQISCFRFHNPFSELISSASTHLVTRLFTRFDVPLPTVDQISRPEWTSFACVLIRKAVFAKVSLLDEGYFMYYEDVDYCRRAKQAGFEVLNYPSSHVVHLRGQSSGLKKLQKDKKRLPAYHYRSRSRYFRKFYGETGLLFANLCWLAGRSLSLFIEVVFGKNRVVAKYQYLDIWKR